MTRMRILLLVLTLGVALCLPQVALAQATSTTVTLSGTVAAGNHTYVLQVRQLDAMSVIGSRSSGPHAGGTAAAVVAGPFAGAYDANLSGAVAGAVVTLTDTSNRNFTTFVSVDGGAFSQITLTTPVTLQGITFTMNSQIWVPALSAQGVLIFLLIASGALLALRRRRSGRMEV